MSALDVDGRGRFGPEQERIVRWRVERLLAAGYDSVTALLIGVELTVDLHVAVDLVRAGCLPETAVRILL
jgi:hypothetical protein